MEDRKTYNVLFLCTGNSARSILAESILNHLGIGKFRGYSAGSHPKGEVHPISLELLRSEGLPISRLRSKSWDEFAAAGAPEMDFVFTVCDQAAGEMCPVWPGKPITAHWGFEDPAAVEGSDEVKRRAFASIYRQIMNRVRVFISLPLDKLDRLAVKREMDNIGLMQNKDG